jgi:hypothetical protein
MALGFLLELMGDESESNDDRAHAASTILMCAGDREALGAWETARREHQEVLGALREIAGLLRAREP